MTRLERKNEYKPHPNPLLLGEGASEACGLNTLLLLKETEHKACEFCVLPRLKGERPASGGWRFFAKIREYLQQKPELPFNASRSRQGWGEVSTLPVILLSSHYSELPFNASRARQGRGEVSTSLSHTITCSRAHFFQSLIVIISKGSNIFTPMGGVVW